MAFTYELVGKLCSSPVVTRHPANPILSARDIPFDASLIFNAGVTKYQGRYVMVFRNDYGKRPGSPHPAHTNIGLAFSPDGVTWTVQPKPCFEMHADDVLRAYDPRLTVMDGKCYMCFAIDTRHGVCGGIAVTEDFDRFEILCTSVPDNRNMVLFPERIGNRYVRLERPFPVYSRGGGSRFDIWYADSPDMRYWGNARLLMGVEHVPFANDKIGPAAPPVKTRRGWLTTFHAVDIDLSRGKNGWEERWQKRYTAGIMLLDLQNPSTIVAMSKQPLIAPEAPYETADGFRNHVIFPGGMILEDSGEVKIYYGAADTVECLASAHVEDLLAACDSPR